MTLDEAKTLLSACVRDELVDHAFGDAEVSWMRNGVEVACGYFGGTGDSVGSYDLITDTEDQKAKRWSFKDADARQLRYLGNSGRHDRNDSIGPDNYIEGQCMPELTLGGVLKEICSPDSKTK